MVRYPRTRCKNNRGDVRGPLREHDQLFGGFLEKQRGIHAATTLHFSSLNLLQTSASVCFVSCQPCGWHMLTLQ